MATTRRCWLLISWLLPLTATSIARSEEFRCAGIKPSATQSPAYARITSGHCEGFFKQSVSQAFVELVSATRNAPRLRGQDALSWRTGSQALLLIQPLRATPFYRVDAELPLDRAFSWDPRPMLAATGLRSEDLGFIATLPARSTMSIELPQVIPLALPGGSAAGVFLTIRASVGLSSLHWRHYPPDQSGSDWRLYDAPAPYAWQAVSLQLPPDEVGQSAARIDVRAKDREGRLLPLLSFIVLPAHGKQ